jgi:2-polyprenyl-3-methyl-5-hydroxy-6-metoxy-1,4-benzoquinol methylase
LAKLADYYTQDYRGEYSDLPADQQYRLDLDEARLRTKRLLPLITEKARLLEIGCGSGAFLDSVRPYCGEVTGVEPHEEYRQATVARSNIPVVASIDELLLGSKRFDTVAMFHVLEHIADPVSFLGKIAQVMDRDGKLLIEVPNVDDVLVSVYKIPAYLRFYYQKAHLYYFSRPTLVRTLEQAGFKATIDGIQRYDLSNHIHWMLTGQPGGQGYYLDMFSPSVNAAYADALIRAGRSDTLWAIARRN